MVEIGSCSYASSSRSREYDFEAQTSCNYASSSKSQDFESQSQINYSAPKEIARTIILIVAVTSTIFMVSDYASMAARFCYKVYSGTDM